MASWIRRRRGSSRRRAFPGEFRSALDLLEEDAKRTEGLTMLLSPELVEAFTKLNRFEISVHGAKDADERRREIVQQM